MKHQIRQRALDLGFDNCRFTTAHPPNHAEEFKRWLGDHRHGEMGYLERNAPKRVDPQLVLPGAKSIITLAASYASPKDTRPVSSFSSCPGGDGNRGTIARYARFNDYHQVLNAKLKEFAVFLNDHALDTRSLWYVDTGPFLERDFAQRSGLGFIGKHTNLISRALGNWIFLAEMITTLEIEPDTPEKNHCGSCTRCLQACPTAAITAPFQLDARRCISYLTIELKGSIPIEFRRAIGNRIYGCDDCLAVCPWNRFAREGELMKSHARSDLEQPDLLELLSLDEPAFKRRFTGTPILRTKRRGFLRNVCVALGNIGDTSALPSLQGAAQDPEPIIAEHAAWAIAEIEERQNSQKSTQGF